MILLVGPRAGGPGGVSTCIRHLGAGLRGMLPDAAWTLFPTDKDHRGAALPIRVVEGARLATSFRATLARRRPRLVHLFLGGDGGSWTLREATVLLALARQAAARTVLHVHSPDLRDLGLLRPSRRPLLRSLWDGADLILALSPDQRDRLEEAWAPPWRLAVVPNGVPVPPIDVPPPRVATPKDPLRLLFLGSVEHRKGVDVLIDAVARVRRARGPVVQVEAHGPFSGPPSQVEQWKTEGALHGISFLGPALPERVPALMKHTDLFVLPSRAEGLPYAVLEAMAATRPVVAGATGAIAAVLEGGAGAAVAPGDAPAVASAVLDLLDDPEHRLDVAAAGWHRVRRSYSVQQNLDGTLGAWRRVLGLAPDGDLAPALR